MITFWIKDFPSTWDVECTEGGENPEKLKPSKKLKELKTRTRLKPAHVRFKRGKIRHFGRGTNMARNKVCLMKKHRNPISNTWQNLKSEKQT